MIEDDTLVAARRLLDLSDRQSATWRKLKKHFETRLAEMRARNDNDLDVLTTAKLRGSVAVIKELLALGDQDPTMEADEG